MSDRVQRISSGDEAALDRLLSALADAQRRQVLDCLVSAREDDVTVGELAEQVERRGPGTDPEQVAVRLHHATLPRLDDAGLVDYRPESKVVSYRGDGLRDGARELVAAVTEGG